MKKIKLTILSLLMIFIQVHGQDYKKLNVFVTDFFDARSSITVEAINYDPLIATDALKNALVINGFKVISEMVAKEKIEINNKRHVTDSTFNQDISAGSPVSLEVIG